MTNNSNNNNENYAVNYINENQAKKTGILH